MDDIDADAGGVRRTRRADPTSRRARVVADYIAGMTDRYAMASTIGLPV